MSLSVIALTSGSPCLADASDQAQQVELPKDGSTGSLIVITGSRIPRPNLTAVSPLTVVPAEEFLLQGATNVDDVLNRLPQVDPSQSEFVSAGASGAATIDLRGLGAVRTLVLVNGHRLVPGDPRYPVPDVNSIPTAMIQRVEVLTGGAGAAYGSDAVAGVVNFILDTKLDGLKIDGQAGGFQHDNRDGFAQALLDRRQLPYPKGSVFDGRRDNLSVAVGHGFLDDRAHVTIYGGYRRIDAVKQDQRDYSACPITAKLLGGNPTSTLECGGPIVSYPGNFFDNLGNVYQVTPDRTFVPGLSRFNFSQWNLIQRPDKRYTAGAFANLDLSRSLHVYGEAMAMRDRSSWQLGPSGDFTNTQTINCDNPLLSSQQKSLICRDGNFVGQVPILDANDNVVTITGKPTQFVDPVTGAKYSRAWLLIALRNIEGDPITDELKHKSIRLLGGINGELGRGVSYDASYLFGRVRLDREYRNNLSISRLGMALDVVSDPSTGEPICRSALIARELGNSAPGADANCVPWDVLAPGHVSQQSIDYLSIPPFMDGSFTQQVGNANATVDLGRWGVGSPLSDESSVINVGVEYRKDAIRFDPGEFAEAADIAGFGEQVFSIRSAVETKEIFGEARIPLLTNRLVERLAFEGGYRKSYYKKAQGHFASDAYKFALDLTAVRGVRLRASLQGANRAPNILELFAPIQPDSFLRDPCAGSKPAASQEQCALTGVAPGQYGQIATVNASRFGYRAILGGNENLQPEAATTRTIGLVLQPRGLRAFNATVDWWDINLKGAISQIGAQAILDSCVASGDPIFCGRIHRDATGPLWLGDGYVDDRLANIGGFRLRGVDVGAGYSIPLGRFGSADLAFGGSYVLRWIVDNGGQSEPHNCVGLFGSPCGMQPRWRHNVRATWRQSSGFSLSLQWRHIGSVELAALNPRFKLSGEISPGYTKLGSQDYLDAAATIRIRRGFQLRLGVNNLLDRQPPLVISNTAAGDGPFNANTYPTWYDPLGRFLFIGLAADLKS